MRVATKYINLTRDFFSAHGVIDYRIVESAGATEGAPAAGTAELIVDITTTGATLAANGLKIVEDGIILRSQANLVAARTAAWDAGTRETARVILDRIAAQARARAFREVRARFAACDAQLVDSAKQKFGVATPFGGPTSSGMLTLHCPPDQVYALTSFPARARRAKRSRWPTSITCSRKTIRFTPSWKRGCKVGRPLRICVRRRIALRAVDGLLRPLNTTKCDSEKLTTKLTRIDTSFAANTGKT